MKSDSVRGTQLQHVLNKVVDQISKGMTRELFQQNIPDYDAEACMHLKERLTFQVAKNVGEEVQALSDENNLDEKFKALDNVISIEACKKDGTYVLDEMEVDGSDQLNETLLNERITLLQKKEQYLQKLKQEIGKKQNEKAQLEQEQEKLKATAEGLVNEIQSLPALVSI